MVATILGILINPRWLPFHRNGYNFLPIRHRWFIFASIPMFYWSSNPLNVFLILPNYDITSKSNMAAKMAAVRSITRIRFIVILEIHLVYIPRLSRLLNTLEQLLLRSDGCGRHNLGNFDKSKMAAISPKWL